MVKAEGKTFDFLSEEAITPDVLETFPFEYRGRDTLVEVETDEWSCVCPFSGLPDYGTLTVSYIPGEVCIELKSLKYYLTSYRQVGIYQEHAANKVLDDLVACAAPQWMEVELEYRLRGGISTTVTVAYGDAEILP